MNELRLIMVPPMVQDMASKLFSKVPRQNEKDNYVQRLEATRDYITEVLEKYKTEKALGS